ncbi:transcription repressor OFP6 [Lathyrus oleraceus]|uniref:Transcription repressor n=1 Tax=Pisum sativum TaxID=3888 RepID=A0A9D4WZU0_PEA|nr:transcription repressor OFP6-like [Pisum sativum]KAI5410929.1 hypothetical protein KIW84_056175 [Pisum sativum]
MITLIYLKGQNLWLQTFDPSTLLKTLSLIKQTFGNPPFLTLIPCQKPKHSPFKFHSSCTTLMSFNINKKKFLRTLFSSNKSCGCLKIKPSNVLEPSLKPKISIYQNQNKYPSSATSSATTDDDDKVLASSPVCEAKTIHHNNNTILKSGTKLIDSIAVEKESKDPYEDFRNSILQMILERKIYAERELEVLLECFLQLNAKCHHQVIVEAFMEICEEIFPKKLHIAVSN